ncbi:MAG: hypothetical protein ACW99U_20170 [Candidatus Thorarchaeota archaeon]|jgi:hypothetical protein
MNLTSTLHAIKDRYAKQLKPFTLASGAEIIHGAEATWNFIRKQGGLEMRIIYECLDGKVRDVIGRQGVYNSNQDGRVENVGHAMTDAGLLTFSFWTATHGSKVNTGAGKGYRTLRAHGVIAIHVNGRDYLTAYGQHIIELHVN